MLEKIFDFYREKFSKTEFVKKPECSKDANSVVEELLPLADKSEEDVFVIIAGIKHYFGIQPFETSNRVHLIKEPSNRYDKNAIAAFCDGFGRCGYVANSESTLRPGALSADLLHGGFSDICTATVLWTDGSYAVCRVDGLNYFDLLFNHVQKLCIDQSFDAALKLLLKLLESRETIEVLQRISECCIRLSRYEDALFYADKALLLDKENSQTHNLRKTIEHLTGQDFD